MKQTISLLLILDTVLIGLGVMGMVINQFFLFSPLLALSVDVVFGIGKIGALILMYQSSKLCLSNVFKRLIFVFFGIALIGILFILEHLPFGGMLLFLSQLAIASVYTLHFFKKRHKQLLDYLKLLWLLVINAQIILKLEHLPFANQMLQVELILFLLMFVFFLYDQWKQAKSLPSVDSFLENDKVQQ